VDTRRVLIAVAAAVVLLVSETLARPTTLKVQTILKTLIEERRKASGRCMMA
jgi:hypothetical protein